MRYGKTPEPETPYQKRRPGLGRAHRLGPRPGPQLAPDGLRLPLPRCRPRRRVGLADDARPVVPYVVEVDRLGAAQAVAPAAADYPPDRSADRLASRALHRERALSCRPTRSSLRQNWLRAYDFVTDQGRSRSTTMPASTTRSPSVGETAGLGRGVERDPRLRRQLPGRLDRAPLRRGQLAATERWTAILTVVVQPPRECRALTKNPLGVYVHAINWSRELAP